MFDSLDYKEELNHLQVGKIAEYWTKLVLTLYGLDVYTTEVDDKGIDFLVRVDQNHFLDIQVKALRIPSSGYTFIPKVKEWEEHRLRDSLYLALVLLESYKMPSVFLIPSTAWRHESALLKNRAYGEGLKSKPEWGINISAASLPLLQEFEAAKQIQNIKNSTP